MRPTAILVTLTLIVAGVLTGCGGNSSPPSPSATAGNATAPAPAPAPDIVVSNYAYAVRTTVKPGQLVTVVNDDQANHSLAADANDAFDVRVSGGGGVETFAAPMTPGTYEFHCKYHAGMHGSLIVQ